MDENARAWVVLLGISFALGLVLGMVFAFGLGLV